MSANAQAIWHRTFEVRFEPVGQTGSVRRHQPDRIQVDAPEVDVQENRTLDGIEFPDRERSIGAQRGRPVDNLYPYSAR